MPEKNLNCFIGLVTYLDYDIDTFQTGNVFAPIMHKRKAFEHEKEIRIVKADKRYWDSELEIKPALGINLSTELISNIEALYINPYATEWYFETIEKLLNKLKFKIPIKWSEIKSFPLY